MIKVCLSDRDELGAFLSEFGRAHDVEKVRRWASEVRRTSIAAPSRPCSSLTLRCTIAPARRVSHGGTVPVQSACGLVSGIRPEVCDAVPGRVLGIVLIVVALFMLVVRGVLHESNLQTPLVTLKAPTSVVILVLGVALFLFPQWWPVVSTARPTPGESPGPSAVATTPAPPDSESARTSASASSSVSPSSTAEPTFAPESVVESVTTKPDLNIRGQAGTSGKPVDRISRGTRMLVLSGPINRDRYDWYEVLTFPASQRDIPSHGWVAAAATNGRPWIGQVSLQCPNAPTTVEELATLELSKAIACLSRRPLTVRGRLLRCEAPVVATIQSDPCSQSPGFIQPQWLDPDGDALPGSEEIDRFVMVDLAGDVRGDSPSVRLILAREAELPETLAEDQTVEVVGVFNHPEAGPCRARQKGDSGGEQTIVCRATFVVTELRILSR